jgi:hypothetical protein
MSDQRQEFLNDLGRLLLALGGAFIVMDIGVALVIAITNVATSK